MARQADRQEPDKTDHDGGLSMDDSEVKEELYFLAGRMGAVLSAAMYQAPGGCSQAASASGYRTIMESSSQV